MADEFSSIERDPYLEVVSMSASSARAFFGLPASTRVEDAGEPRDRDRWKPGARVWRVYASKSEPPPAVDSKADTIPPPKAMTAGEMVEHVGNAKHALSIASEYLEEEIVQRGGPLAESDLAICKAAIDRLDSVVKTMTAEAQKSERKARVFELIGDITGSSSHHAKDCAFFRGRRCDCLIGDLRDAITALAGDA